MHVMREQYFLRCGCGHSIPLPRPIPAEISGDQQEKDRADRKAVFVCTDCGLVSGYTSQDVRESFLPTPDPHQAKALTLGYIEPECDGARCEVPKRLYMLGSGPESLGSLPMRKTLKDWRISPSATCDAGHQLVLRCPMYRWYECNEFPL
jgi:hypothetical protein